MIEEFKILEKEKCKIYFNEDLSEDEMKEKAESLIDKQNALLMKMNNEELRNLIENSGIMQAKIDYKGFFN